MAFGRLRGDQRGKIISGLDKSVVRHHERRVRW